MASEPVQQLLRFTVFRKPVSVNEAYVRAKFSSNRGAGGGRGLVLSAAGREYKEACRAHAKVAATREGWPIPDRVKSVALLLVAWNTKHDVDAPIKLTLDALEGVVYVKDSVVQRVTCGKNSDAGKPRVEVTVELLRSV